MRIVLGCLLGAVAIHGLAPAAPLPKDDHLRPEDLAAAVGRPPSAKEVRVIARALGSRPTASFNTWVRAEAPADPPDDGFYLVWKDRGLDLYVEGGRVRSVFLFNQGAGGHERYAGPLPRGLGFGDDVAAVERKLGPAEWVTRHSAAAIDGRQVRLVTRDWYTKGLHVRTEVLDDAGRERVWCVTLEAPRQPPRDEPPQPAEPRAAADRGVGSGS